MINIIQVILVICLMLLGIFTLVGFGYNLGRDDLLQNLCKEQQYDFCEVKEVIYTIKENKE